MSKPSAYIYNQSGQAVAAVYLGITVRKLSADPALQATDIAIPRLNPKARLILSLTGMAAEKKGVGTSDPLRRTRNRQRIKSHLESVIAELKGSTTRRQAKAKTLLSQSQDRANAICNNLNNAIERVALRLMQQRFLDGKEVEAIVKTTPRGPGPAR